ncbi:MAG: hypothetical protein ACYC2R_02630 [Burkholderiales bacterium]
MRPQIAANPHPNLPLQAGEGVIVSPPACVWVLRGGLAPLPQPSTGAWRMRPVTRVRQASSIRDSARTAVTSRLMIW